jgi:hypothetical protein
MNNELTGSVNSFVVTESNSSFWIFYPRNDQRTRPDQTELPPTYLDLCLCVCVGLEQRRRRMMTGLPRYSPGHHTNSDVVGIRDVIRRNTESVHECIGMSGIATNTPSSLFNIRQGKDVSIESSGHPKYHTVTNMKSRVPRTCPCPKEFARQGHSFDSRL